MSQRRSPNPAEGEKWFEAIDGDDEYGITERDEAEEERIIQRIVDAISEKKNVAIYTKHKEWGVTWFRVAAIQRVCQRFLAFFVDTISTAQTSRIQCPICGETAGARHTRHKTMRIQTW